MKTLSELLRELHELPEGNIYVKHINGRDYYYHQYFDHGKRFTKIIKQEELESLKTGIKRRQIVEKEIRKIKSQQKSISISKSAQSLTGTIMSENKPVAIFEQGNLVWMDEDLAPLVIKRTHFIEEFLKLRTMDMSRTNARILKRVLNIHVDEDYKTSLYSYALSVSDHYWFKPKHSKLKFRDITFKDSSYFETALKGDTTAAVFVNQLTPEITTTGSFEKGWKYIDGTWWLYKSGSKNQIFAELFCYHFAKLIGLDTAVYEYDDGYIRSQNFATQYNFEPLAALLGDDDSYESVYQYLYKINPDIAKQYLFLVSFDAVTYNVDRHNENVGLFRDRKTGAIVSLAPNFDNNLALYTVDEIHLSEPKSDGLIKNFLSFLKNNEQAKKQFLEIKFVGLNEKQIQQILDQIPIKLPDEDEFVKSIITRFNYLKTYFNN